MAVTDSGASAPAFNPPPAYRHSYLDTTGYRGYRGTVGVEILQDGRNSVSMNFNPADHQIALGAEDSAHLTGGVVVVNVCSVLHGAIIS